MTTTKARVLVLADVPGWAWDRKAQAYGRWLAGREFDITLAYHSQVPDLAAYDLVHCFEVSQLDRIPEGYPGALLAGLTAHVWRTWGEARMRAWTQRCTGLHANSRLLVEELKPFHPVVYYTPNGVDPEFFRRFRERAPGSFIACHVGKPNPRKGSALIVEACLQAGVETRFVLRTSHIRLSWEEIRRIYQEASVQVTMSDMDGTPNPMLESAACGNALISTPIGNMPEFIVPRVNGLLVERTVGSLVSALEWCKAHPADVEAMGLNARQEVLDNWTWEGQVEHVRTAWLDALESERIP